jgi:hypothetical protein
MRWEENRQDRRDARVREIDGGEDDATHAAKQDRHVEVDDQSERLPQSPGVPGALAVHLSRRLPRGRRSTWDTP